MPPRPPPPTPFRPTPNPIAIEMAWARTPEGEAQTARHGLHSTGPLPGYRSGFVAGSTGEDADVAWHIYSRGPACGDAIRARFYRGHADGEAWAVAVLHRAGAK